MKMMLAAVWRTDYKGARSGETRQEALSTTTTVRSDGGRELGVAAQVRTRAGCWLSSEAEADRIC